MAIPVLFWLKHVSNMYFTNQTITNHFINNMRKFRFLLAALLVPCLAVNAQDGTSGARYIFSEGFEQGEAMFTDPLVSLADSTVGLYYYPDNAYDATLKQSDLVRKDTVIKIYNGFYNWESHGDKFEFITDPGDEHRLELEELGGEGGNTYMKYTTGGAATDDKVGSNESYFAIRGVPVEDNTSYRLVYYVKATANAAGAVPDIECDLICGGWSSWVPMTMSGTGTEFVSDQEIPQGVWTRMTSMAYYHNDSVSNYYLHYNGRYWWASYWSWDNPENGQTYTHIQLPKNFYYRFSFRGRASTYLVDDLQLVKSMIGGAEYNGDVIRVNFGYQTNLPQLAENGLGGALAVPEEAFMVTAWDPYLEEDAELTPMFAEYHTDGYLYLWMEDDCDDYENLKVSFFNPEEKEFQLVYNGTLYPNSLDTAWVNAGKIVANFEGEPVQYNPLVSALPIGMVAPEIVTTVPDNGSFGLDASKDRQFKVIFNKACYVGENGVEASIAGSGLRPTPLTCNGFNAEDNSVTFTLPSSFATTAVGDYTITVANMKASTNGVAGEPQTFELSYGPVSIDEPTFYMRSNFDEIKKDGVIPEGWLAHDSNGDLTENAPVSTNNAGLRHFKDGGMFIYAFYLDPRQGNNLAWARYGEVEGNSLMLPAGMTRFRFMYSGYSGAKTPFTFSIYKYGDESQTPIYSELLTPNKAYSRVNGNSGDVVDAADIFQQDINIPEEGAYVMEWRINKNGYSGLAFANIEVSNCYSKHRNILVTFNNAYAEAQALSENVLAQSSKYTGADYTLFVENSLTKYNGFTSTSPLAYDAATKAIKNEVKTMNARISTIDTYYSTYATAYTTDTAAVTAGNAELAAYKALNAILNENATIDVTKKTSDEMTALTSEISAANTTYNNRVSLMNTFETSKQNAANSLEANAEAYSNYAEYIALQSASNTAAAIDVITVSDEDLTAANTALTSATKQMANRIETVTSLTTQVKELYAEAEKIGVNWDEFSADAKQNIDEAMKVVDTDDRTLVDILKSAIKYEMIKKMAAGEVTDTINVTGLIDNFSLYCTATINEEVEHYTYNYNGTFDRWRIKSGKSYETVYPYWTVSGSGNCHVTNETTIWTNKAEVSDGWIAFDWSSTFDLAQTITDLPQGIYSIGVGYNSQLTTGMLLADNGEKVDTVMVPKTNSDYPTMPNVFADGVVVNGDLTIRATAASGNGWGRVDNWALYLTGAAEGVDYAALVEAQKAKVKEALTTVSEINQDATEKYYNLNGMEQNAGRGILIRVRTAADGSRKVEKVLK